MASKVDSLNIVSNTKPLSVVSKPENNSNIEVFSNNDTKANIDEVAISTANTNIEPKEKNDNRKKWLIGAGIALGIVAVGVTAYFLCRSGKTSKATNILDKSKELTETIGKKVIKMPSSCEDITKYIKATGKSSLLETKAIQGKINPEELGVVFPDGMINFQNEESALKYIKTKLIDSVNRPQAQQFERAIVKKGTTIIGQADGNNMGVSIVNIKGMEDRFLLDIPRDIELYHSHPDVFGKGKTTPLSSGMGDLQSFLNLKLKKIVAINSNGEFNSIEVAKDFTEDKFTLFIKGIDNILNEKVYGKTWKEFNGIQAKLTELITKGEIEKAALLSEKVQELSAKMTNISTDFFYTQDYVNLTHEYYKRAKNFGTIYSTNFSNLT